MISLLLILGIAIVAPFIFLIAIILDVFIIILLVFTIIKWLFFLPFKIFKL